MPHMKLEQIGKFGFLQSVLERHCTHFLVPVLQTGVVPVHATPQGSDAASVGLGATIVTTEGIAAAAVACARR